MSMPVDFVQIRSLAKQKEGENRGVRRFVKLECNLDSEEMDAQVFDATRRVWAGIDCTACANCCREVRPTFSNQDVDRLAARLKMPPQRFIDAYLDRNEEGEANPWQTRSMPCAFLKENRCSVYEDRPADCQRYPYLYEPEFAFRTMAMVERTFTCPIVYEVMEELKRAWGFLKPDRR